MLPSFFPAVYASPARSLADPDGSGVVVAAVGWLQGTLLGTVATTIAVIAVAWVGLMMLAGRTSVRHGLNVVAGCFILFGAATIAAGIRAAASGAEPAAEAVPLPPPAPPLVLPAPPAGNPDPYAGASVPAR